MIFSPLIAAASIASMTVGLPAPSLWGLTPKTTPAAAHAVLVGKGFEPFKSVIETDKNREKHAYVFYETDAKEPHATADVYIDASSRRLVAVHVTIKPQPPGTKLLRTYALQREIALIRPSEEEASLVGVESNVYTNLRGRSGGNALFARCTDYGRKCSELIVNFTGLSDATTVVKPKTDYAALDAGTKSSENPHKKSLFTLIPVLGLLLTGLYVAIVSRKSAAEKANEAKLTEMGISKNWAYSYKSQSFYSCMDGLGYPIFLLNGSVVLPSSSSEIAVKGQDLWISGNILRCRSEKEASDIRTQICADGGLE